MITIPHSSLLDALATANALGLTIGADYEIISPANLLKIKPAAIDRLLTSDLVRELEDVSSQNSEMPQRIDREVGLQGDYALRAAQIESSFAAAWESATSDVDRSLAIRSRNLARRILRVEVVTPIAQADIQGSTLVYGATFEGCRCLDEADGRRYEVQTLIHFTHPSSPEDLYLRECRVIADRILRYYIPGLEDGIWMRQNEPRRRLDALGWRDLLTQRLQAQNGILGSTAKGVTLDRQIV